MDTKNLEVILKLKDQFSGPAAQTANTANRAFAGLTSTVGKLAVAYLSLRTVQMVTRWLAESTRMAAEEDAQIAKLNASLEACGNYSVQASQGLMAYAGELQKTLGISDGVTISVLGTVEALTHLSAEALPKAMDAIIQISNLYNTDYQQAAILLGKTLNSQVNAFARYGIQVDMASDAQTRLNQIVAQTAPGMDIAIAKSNTYEGQINKLKLAYDDYREAVGRTIAQSPGVARAIQMVTDKLVSYTGRVDDARGSTADLAGQMAVFSARAMIMAIDAVSGSLSTMIGWANAALDAINYLKAGQTGLTWDQYGFQGPEDRGMISGGMVIPTWAQDAYRSANPRGTIRAQHLPETVSSYIPSGGGGGGGGGGGATPEERELSAAELRAMERAREATDAWTSLITDTTLAREQESRGIIDTNEMRDAEQSALRSYIDTMMRLNIEMPLMVENFSKLNVAIQDYTLGEMRAALMGFQPDLTQVGKPGYKPTGMIGEWNYKPGEQAAWDKLQANYGYSSGKKPEEPGLGWFGGGLKTLGRNDTLWGLAGAAGSQLMQGGGAGDVAGALLPMIGSAFGPVGTVVGSILGGLFGKKKNRGESKSNPVFVYDVKSDELAMVLLNITKMWMSGSAAHGGGADVDALIRGQRALSYGYS